MKLSIVIVNYNVKFFLEQCLHSVFKALPEINTEVFVVDNNSVDGSVEMMEEKFPSVKLIANETNQGFSKANNQAIKIANGEYVLLLNPDTVVEEDTFKKVISFMDAHPGAGGLGVHMIDGKGNFLPESKRGLPTPSVAFYKIFGLSALFPKSKIFGKYHLGFLDKNKTAEVEVLSGAFMLLRKTALDKTGLLDETFFMYGEDIDISYRIIKAGYKNYYFPETRIIHYKGESTKKSSVNYVMVFYKAMMIFAFKHFSQSSARLFSFLISFAIYVRAGAAIVTRFIQKLFLPFCDALLFYAGMYLLKSYWETSVKALHYPPLFMNIVVPVYILIWIFSVYLSGGYDKPIRISKIIRGIFTGAVFILVVYALLPEHYRFSRALILLGTVWASLSSSALRLVLNFTGIKKFKVKSDDKKRTIIVGDADEGKRVLSVLNLSGTNINFIGFVNTIGNGMANNPSKISEYSLGTIVQLNEIIEVYDVNEIIFCAKDISAQQIIQQMQSVSRMNVEYKIAPPESLYIIGSNSINDQGDLYFVDINAMTTPANKRNKRLLDFSLCVSILVLSPVLIFIVKDFSGMLSNWLKVFAGKQSWVGLAQGYTGNSTPGKSSSYKKGVLTPLDSLKKTNLDESTVSRLNVLYAKEYSVYTDLRIFTKGLKNLGRIV
ncbi:MAG TPA: glycosyltransferase [Bacteroidia bacterium]|nr:glycosyltransferase [Bacteroidia bacterium]